LFLVWWSIKDLSRDDKSQIKQSLKHARYLLIIPVYIILLLSHYVRGLRWRLLIEPLGYSPKKSNAFFAVMIGYLTNLAFPRLGEVLKCTALSRYEKIPVDKLIGTIILERIIDVLTLLIVFGITLLIQPGIYTQLIETFFQSSVTVETKKTSGFLIIAVVTGVIILLVAGWMIIKKKKLADLISLVKKIIKSVWEGVSAIQHLKKRMSFIILTVILWSLYLFCGYIGFYGLQETEQYGLKEAFTVLSAGSIAMIVTPGGIGAYALILEKTMQLYGLQKGIALAFGWMLWIAQTSALLIGGLFSFVALPYFNKKQSEKV
ncbi:MAG TPA: lysylphosphatidylglycerol synthase transmembrane domain-containing protein, partial [Chitinophagaceae bacterium]|nr:lysylphosphatidylglycerol synthase transmembrane domain-containing protein [Chitinophagaceae bacterium]